MPELRILADWYGDRAIDYTAAWELQRTLHAQRVENDITDTLLLLEHPAVYTAGKRTEPHERPVGTAIPVVDVDRGGKITYHGPGQLVGYPIVRLPGHVLVVDYVRRLEEALIRALADFDLSTGRVPGRSGVWLAEGNGRPERKISALGLRVSRGVAMHGFSLNCNVDLAAFSTFVPCGIDDAGVTSMSAELGREITPEQAAPVVERHVRELLDWQPFEMSPDIEHAVGLLNI